MSPQFPPGDILGKTDETNFRYSIERGTRISGTGDRDMVREANSILILTCLYCPARPGRPKTIVLLGTNSSPSCYGLQAQTQIPELSQPGLRPTRAKPHAKKRETVHLFCDNSLPHLLYITVEKITPCKIHPPSKRHEVFTKKNSKDTGGFVILPNE